MAQYRSFAEQWSNSDTDAKSSLLTSLASTLQDTQSPVDLEQYSAALSESLHSPHHALVLASLKALPPFFQALARAGPSPQTERILKHTAISCLSQHGNLMDKMGDPKIGVREAARATLLDASTCALGYSSANVPESAAALIDKMVREHGFGSKNARVREASLRYLAALRTSPSTALRTDQLPSLRPYFQPLMHTLEDSDPTVRDAAKESTVVIFADIRISDAARAELKKEISKGSVRKGTVEHVLSRVFGGGSTSTAQEPPTVAELEAGADGQPPASLGASSSGTALTSADIAPVYIASARDLENEFHRMVDPFEGKETEHNWQSRDKSISRIRGNFVGGKLVIKLTAIGTGMLKGDVAQKYEDAFVKQIKLVSAGIARCMVSLRTTLAVSAVYLVAELAQALQASLDSLFELFFGTLVKLAAGTKKLLVAASEAAMSSLLTNCTCISRMCQMLSAGMAEKSAVARTAISSQLPVLLREHGSRDRATFDMTGASDMIDKSLRKALTDATPSVREKAREAYWVYFEVWTPEAERIAASLDTQGRSQLEKAKAKAGGSLAASTSNLSRPASSASTKPSVRELIAARKAAAKKPSSQAPSETASAPTEVPSGSASTSRQSKPTPSRAPPSSVTSPNTLNTPTHKPVSRPSAHANGSSSFNRSVQDPRRGSLTQSPSKSSSPASIRRPGSVTSSPETTPQKLPAARRSMAPDRSVNLLAFATPAAASNPPLDSRSLSSLSGDDSILAERMAQHNLLDVTMDADSGMALEAMRNQADQAEQTAERLLELAADEEDGPLTATLPQSYASPSASSRPIQAQSASTPAVFRHGKGISKDFEDSPAVSKPRGTFLLGTRATQDSWWLEKAKHARPASPLDSEQEEHQLQVLIAALLSTEIQPAQIRKLSRISSDHPLPITDETPEHMGFWSSDKRGTSLVSALLVLLAQPVSPEVKEASMLLLKDLVCNQPRLISQYETQLFSLLLTLRQESAIQTSAASGAILDLYLQQQDTLSALSTLRSCLASFTPSSSGSPSNSKSFSFGLKGLSALFQTLPAEVLEDQIPLTSPLILQALNSTVTDVRQSGIMALVAAQSVLQDEQRLFGMFKSDEPGVGGGLTEQQMALATYYFAKADNQTG